jgi:hypothetical protein
MVGLWMRRINRAQKDKYGTTMAFGVRRAMTRHRIDSFTLPPNDLSKQMPDTAFIVPHYKAMIALGRRLIKVKNPGPKCDFHALPGHTIIWALRVSVVPCAILSV